MGQTLVRPEEFCFVFTIFCLKVPSEISFEKNKIVQMQTIVKTIGLDWVHSPSQSYSCLPFYQSLVIQSKIEQTDSIWDI